MKKNIFFIAFLLGLLISSTVFLHFLIFSPSFFPVFIFPLCVSENNSHSLYKVNETIWEERKITIKIPCESHNAASDMP